MGSLAPAPQEGTKGGREQRGQQVQTQPEAKEAAARCQIQASYCRHHDHLLQPLPQAAAGRDELPAQEGQAGAQRLEAIQVSSLPPTGLWWPPSWGDPQASLRSAWWPLEGAGASLGQRGCQLVHGDEVRERGRVEEFQVVEE